MQNQIHLLKEKFHHCEAENISTNSDGAFSVAFGNVAPHGC